MNALRVIRKWRALVTCGKRALCFSRAVWQLFSVCYNDTLKTLHRSWRNLTRARETRCWVVTMMHWYLLYTKVHAERQLAANLTRLGYEAYLPMIPVVQPRRDRPVEKPFFPGYVFIHYDLKEWGIGKIAYTPGLRSIVMFGGEAAVVPDADVARIREQLAQQSLWDKSGVPLRPGDAVEILSESFEGVDAVFDRTLTPNERVRVFLRYLEEHRLERKRVERLIPLELDAQLVRKKESRA